MSEGATALKNRYTVSRPDGDLTVWAESRDEAVPRMWAEITRLGLSLQDSVMLLDRLEPKRRGAEGGAA